MSLLKTQQTNGILTVTISRPDALNALNSEVMNGLQKIMHDVYQNAGIRGMILTGEGEKAFVAGADIRELAALSQQQALELAQKGQKLFKSLEDCDKPVIAAVNGFALGGGCELAMACHMRLATENARFGQPEVNLGIIPGYGGTQRLTQLVGRGKALELMLTADIITAQEAKNLGLVNHVVATRDELMALAEKIMTKILSKGPLAVANVIKSVNAGFSFESEGYAAEATHFGECAATGDFKEGTAAFLEKRQPVFKGK
ncbi:enoyl-CoA hydratase/isomerase family protein [Fulvivirgaceae bacterium PWU4]|uniref:Enoyl-CoA hydratase/isomerase family protein n=1 Tax=Chryseosolibacter histidini TaxID=2782349 RepID=A0AAP2DQA2_9BACT|nr:enoyl-CoA hydratase-related protein [Chryseosolibacter histidini]MBT1700575.1 enoyl-CoA hydratase/isomerase family protein [Chryseosolibacter histidini]